MNQVHPVVCPRCNQRLPWSLFNVDRLVPCPACKSETYAYSFPALIKGVTPGQAGERIVSAEEASCFYHGQKKAVVSCDHCGRFLCALCDVEFGGRHLCPVCIEMGHGKKKMQNLENHRVLYDDAALALAIYPFVFFVFFYFTLITAPLSLLLAIRHWNSPSSIIPRTKARLILAIFFSSAQIIGWCAAAYFIFSSLT